MEYSKIMRYSGELILNTSLNVNNKRIWLLGGTKYCRKVHEKCENGCRTISYNLIGIYIEDYFIEGFIFFMHIITAMIITSTIIMYVSDRVCHFLIALLCDEPNS